MKLEALFQNPHALPTAPKVVEELINSFDDPSASSDSIAKKLSTDPVLSAKLLRLANSAYYHVSRSIGTVDDAVLMLGFVTVRTLVISSGLVGGFKTVPGLDLKQFWRYNLHAAVAAKWIAKQARENTDLAFTIGMMHSIGQLVIHAAMPEQAVQLDKEVGPFDPRRLEAEQNAFGYGFADVGAELAVRWKFPEIFSSTIRAFPQPLAATPPSRMAAVIHLAAWCARRGENKFSAEDISASYPTELCELLGLPEDVLIDGMPNLDELAAGLEELVH